MKAKIFNFTLFIIFIGMNAESVVNRKCRLGTRLPHPYDCGKYMVKKSFSINTVNSHSVPQGQGIFC